jgi:hypothetical protein
MPTLWGMGIAHYGKPSSNANSCFIENGQNMKKKQYSTRKITKFGDQDIDQ